MSPAPLTSAPTEAASDAAAVLALDPDWDPPHLRPRLRGWLHAGAFVLAVAMSAALIPSAAQQSGRAALGVSVYCVFMVAMFATSALYHRVEWGPRGWAVMKRLDHSMIFLFIAGTYTPFGLLSLPAPTAAWVLGAVWGGGALGITLKVFWPRAPRWVGVPVYVVVGWIAVLVLPDLAAHAGVGALVLLLVGGAFYSVGAVFYAVNWPNPVPGVVGYHEVFHACTVVAAVCQYVAVWFAVYAAPIS